MKIRFSNINNLKSIPFLMGLAICLSLVLLPSTAFTQELDLSLFGSVKDFDTRKKIEGCQVNIYVGSSKLKSFTTNKSGKYDFFLPLDKNYKVEFSKPGYVTKFLEINAGNIPQEDRRSGFAVGPMEASLFKEVEGLDFSILQEAVGKFKYNQEHGAIEWDFAYGDAMANKINKMMSDYEKKIKNENKEEDRLAKEMEKKQADFDKLVADGNASMTNDKFDVAVTKYEAALVIFSDKPDVKAKLDEAKVKLEEKNKLANQEKEFNELIDKGDDNFDAKNFDEAIALYQQALKVKPDAKYPTDRITLAETQLAKIRDLKEQEEKIEQLMADGDKAIAAEDFNTGIASYEEILKIDSSNKEADGKLDAAYAAQKDFEAQAKARESYDAAMAEANDLFSAGDYEKAKSKYSTAAELMPKESLPKEKIEACTVKIEEKLAADKAAEELAAVQEKFNRLVSEADEMIANQNFDEGISKYDEALNLVDDKDPDVLAKKQAAIDAREQAGAAARANEEYEAAINQADKAFDAKDFQEAINVYKEALAIKKDQDHPTSRIAEAEAALAAIKDAEAAALAEEERRKEEEAQEAERQRLYDQYMAAAETASASEDFEGAIDNYKSALTVFETDGDAKSLLSKAEKDLEEQRANMADAERKQAEEDARLKAEAEEAERDAKFNEAMALDEKSREEAERLAEEERLKQEALDAEQARLDEEARLEAERLAEEARKRKLAADQEQALKDAEEDERNKYLGHIKDGDKFFASKDYRKSLSQFESAVEMRPDEKYPASRIEKIQALLDQQEKDEQRLAEREAKRKEREEAATFSRGNDLGSSEEDDIDARIAQEKRDRELARWQSMEDFKNGVREAQQGYVNKDNEQLRINQEAMATVRKNAEERAQDAKKRHEDLSSNMQGYKEGLDAQNKRLVEKHNSQIEQNREELASLKTYTKDYVNSPEYQKMKAANDQKVKDQQEFVRKMAQQGREKTQKTQEEMNALKEKYRGDRESLVKREREKIATSTAASDKLKENIAAFNAKGTKQQIQNAKDIADQSALYADQEQARINEAKKKREESFDAIQDIETYNTKKDPMSYGQSDLSANYPQGVTEESSEEGRNLVLRRIVVTGNKAHEYKKVSSVSGTFYFKDGQSTSKYIWDIESRQVLD